jgi:ribosomal protein S27E
MCISSFLKYMLLSVVVGTLIIFSIFFENLFYALPAMIFAIIWSKITCQKCGTSILKDTNGWYMFTVRSACRTCGHDTMICGKEN